MPCLVFSCGKDGHDQHVRAAFRLKVTVAATDATCLSLTANRSAAQNACLLTCRKLPCWLSIRKQTILLAHCVLSVFSHSSTQKQCVSRPAVFRWSRCATCPQKHCHSWEIIQVALPWGSNGAHSWSGLFGWWGRPRQFQALETLDLHFTLRPTQAWA